MPYFLIVFLLLFMPMAWAEVNILNENCNNQYTAKIVSLQGTFWVDAERNGNWRRTRLNQLICQGSIVKVAPNSKVSLRFESGYFTTIEQGSVLSLDAISPDKPYLMQLLSGFIHVISRLPRRLTIKTPIANGGPEGTEFAMSVDDNKASLWVYEGGVKFYNDKGSVFLKPGEGGQTLKGQTPQAKIDIKTQDAVTWALYYPPVLPYPDAATVIDSELRTAINDFRQGHTDTALGRLEGLSTEKQTPYFCKARAAMRLTVGQDKLALQDIQALLNNNPNDSDALALHSILALTQNRKDEAYALANKATTANPQSASAFSALSYAEQSRFQLEKAQAAADQATKLAPHDAMVWARKAELELSQGLNSKSQQAAEKAIALDANLERTQTVLGFSYLLRMDTDAAIETFTKAIDFDSTSPLARLGLGLAKIRNGDLEEGRQDLETAAILDPNNSIVRSYLGKAYYEERRSLLAEDQFKLAKELDPKDPTSYFYDAINKQTTNRPVEALQDMQKAIELNDNRAVYRSKFLLDKDTAARQVGLGRIYNNLGFDDPSNREAMKSLAIDPSNYSAHRLLSDSYATKPRNEIARSSEYLQSQLLQPLNYNPIQPSLAYTDLNIIRGIGPNETAFNEYNRLFERNGIRFTTTGIAGSNSTLGDEAALSGIYNKFSYSLGQLHYDTNGFRNNNDLKHNIYNAFAQYEISSEVNVQAEYRHRETEHGDLELNGDSSLSDQKYRRTLDQDTYRFGIRFSPAYDSDLLGSLIYSNRKENISFLTPIESNQVDKVDTENFQLESQYIFKQESFNLLVGGGAFLTINESTTNVTNCPIFDPQPCEKKGIPSKSPTDLYFGYVYSNIKLLKNLTTTLGLSFDSYKDESPLTFKNINQFSPKFGLNWKINNYASMRMAAFQAIKSPIVVNQVLQPTQIAGFNQLFDDINGTKITQYGIGLDFNFPAIVYTGIEAYKRELDGPIGTKFSKKQEEFYRIYFNFIPVNEWALNSELRFENYRGGDDTPRTVELGLVPLTLRYFNKNGFFANLGGTFVHQSVDESNMEKGKFISNFFLVDASLGYRFPKQFGLISLEANNLLDKNFKYKDRNFQMNENRSPDIIPERLLFARITLNF